MIAPGRRSNTSSTAFSMWNAVVRLIPMRAAVLQVLVPAVRETLAEVKALTEHEWPAHYSWSTLVNGGMGPVYTLAVYHDSWASMAEPDTPLPALMEKAYGRMEADNIMQAISDSVLHVDSWMARLRPDLSYIPASGY